MQQRSFMSSNIFNDAKVEEEEVWQTARQEGADVALVNGLGSRANVPLEVVAYIILWDTYL